MNYHTSPSSIFARIGLTILVLSLIYYYLGPPSYVEAEMINAIFFYFIVPPILIGSTIILTFLIGAPLRMIPRLFNWWCDRPYISLILLVVGIVFCFLSTQFPEPHVRNSEGQIEEGSNYVLLAIGWFIVSFSLIHFYFESFIEFLKNKFGSRNSW